MRGLILLLCCSFFFASCGPRAVYSPIYYVGPRSSAVTDSLQLHATLSSSSLSLADVKAANSWSQSLDLSTGHLSARFKLINQSSQAFLIRWYDIYPEVFGSGREAALMIEVGSKTAGYSHDVEVIPDLTRPCDSCFYLMGAHDSVEYPWHINISSFFWPGGDKLRAGRYWALVFYSNVWADSTANRPMWKGKIHSDTLWFDLTE